MASPTHLLDTSALLAHYFDEPGAAEVDALWQDSGHEIAICTLTVPELHSRLVAELPELPEQIEHALERYFDELTSAIAVDRQVAEEAARLRAAARGRVPLVDACIAAAAVSTGAILVHRDPHFDRLPPERPRQLRLPERHG